MRPRFLHLSVVLLVSAMLQLSAWAQDHGAAHRHRVQLAVGAAFAPDGKLWVVGLDEAARLMVRSADTQQSYVLGPPRYLDVGNDQISADGENRPKIAFGPRGQVIISYTQPLSKPYTGQIRFLRSTDGGLTFTPPATLHDDRQEITHRFESIAFDDRGDFHAVWIDKRDGVSAPKVGNQSTYRGAAIYGKVSKDGGLTFGKDYKVADHSCECCRIALAPAPDGSIKALWRHVFEPNVRDHAFATLGQATVGEPVRATFDDWQIQACPHHGPGLAPASGGGFHATWFGIKAGVAAVRYGRLNDDGTPQSSAVRALPDETAEHADVASSGDQVAVVWRSVNGRTTRLMAWLSVDGGRSFTLHRLDEVQGPNDHPRLVQKGAKMAVVWRNLQEIRAYDIKF